MIEAKRREEEIACNSQFRSKPVPTEVIIPRYQSILEAD